MTSYEQPAIAESEQLRGRMGFVPIDTIPPKPTVPFSRLADRGDID